MGDGERVVEDDGDVMPPGNIAGGGGRAEARGQFSGGVAHLSISDCSNERMERERERDAVVLSLIAVVLHCC